MYIYMYIHIDTYIYVYISAGRMEIQGWLFVYKRKVKLYCDRERENNLAGGLHNAGA